MRLELVDTHCHLNHPPLCHDTGGVLERAAAAGIGRVVAPAYDEASWTALLALADRPGVSVAFGLHPWLAHEAAGGEAVRGLVTRLAGLCERRRPVAIGEIGLDTKISASGLAEQSPLLERQLELAVDLDLPVILHCRGAFPELLAAIARHGGRLRGVLHAFSRGPELAERFVAAGLHIALGGAATRAGARQVRAAVRGIPADRLVLETDAPAIGLQDVPPDQTEPRHVREVATAVALLRGEAIESVAAATTANARDLFGL